MPENRQELLRLHVEAVWDVRLPPLTRDEVVLLEGGQPVPWAVYIAELTAEDTTQTLPERSFIWQPDIDTTRRRTLRERADDLLKQAGTNSIKPDMSREVVLHQIAQPARSIEAACQIAQPLTSEHRTLIEEFQPGEAAYFLDARRAPIFGVIHAGRLLSIAHSSRRTARACELGVDTLPEARRKGYALAATLLWASAVAREGLIPFYSALAENTASLRLAHAAGYRAFARGTTISSDDNTV